MRDKEYLVDILDAISLALKYAAGKGYDDFIADTELQDAVIRRLEIIGEAVRRISEAFKQNHPAIPWQKIVNMRNLMIHEYNDIDLDFVWQTLSVDLNALEKDIKKLLEILN
jgi:uncharacterized protein with HEPN domain